MTTPDDRAKLTKAQLTAPKIIWLELGDDLEVCEVGFSELSDVTWSEDNATGYGVEYIRADLAADLPDEVRAAIEVTAYANGYRDGQAFAAALTRPDSAAPAGVERNFCERCGKRLFNGIHTCTPPLDDERGSAEPVEWHPMPDSYAGNWLTNGAALHPLTINLVVRFARALAAKLSAAEQKYGYSDGWRNDDWQQECSAKLLEHVAKGDPRDVAAYCAFMWHHGWSTAPARDGSEPGLRDRLLAALERAAKAETELRQLKDGAPSRPYGGDPAEPRDDSDREPEQRAEPQGPKRKPCGGGCLYSPASLKCDRCGNTPFVEPEANGHDQADKAFDNYYHKVRAEMGRDEWRAKWTEGKTPPQLSLVRRLRDTPNWMRESYGIYKEVTSVYDRSPFEAADELERLAARASAGRKPE